MCICQAIGVVFLVMVNFLTRIDLDANRWIEYTQRVLSLTLLCLIFFPPSILVRASFARFVIFFLWFSLFGYGSSLQVSLPICLTFCFCAEFSKIWISDGHFLFFRFFLLQMYSRSFLLLRILVIEHRIVRRDYSLNVCILVPFGPF